jgi:hypothetical protein
MPHGCECARDASEEIEVSMTVLHGMKSGTDSTRITMRLMAVIVGSGQRPERFDALSDEASQLVSAEVRRFLAIALNTTDSPQNLGVSVRVSRRYPPHPRSPSISHRVRSRHICVSAQRASVGAATPSWSAPACSRPACVSQACRPAQEACPCQDSRPQNAC